MKPGELTWQDKITVVWVGFLVLSPLAGISIVLEYNRGQSRAAIAEIVSDPSYDWVLTYQVSGLFSKATGRLGETFNTYQDCQRARKIFSSGIGGINQSVCVPVRKDSE